MPDAVTDLVTQVRARLADAADPAKAGPMRAYLKSEMPCLGVYSGPQRAVLRAVLPAHPLPDRSSWEAAVRLLWDEAAFREERYAALALAGHRLYRGHQDLDTLALYRHLVVTGAWWDYVDQIAARLVGDIVRADPERAVPVMRDWAVDPHLWVRRTAIICQLGSKDETDVDLLRHALEVNLEGSPHGRDFFIRKACGWALRQHARTDPAWVLAFVDEHSAELSGLTRREALKHLR